MVSRPMFCFQMDPKPAFAQAGVTADVVKSECTDFAVAFDGDLRQCFFFDENGNLCRRYDDVTLGIHLLRGSETEIVHDPRVIWNTQDIVAQKAVLPSIQNRPPPSISKPCAHEANAGGDVTSLLRLCLLRQRDDSVGIDYRTCLSLRRSLGDWVKIARA